MVKLMDPLVFLLLLLLRLLHQSTAIGSHLRPAREEDVRKAVIPDAMAVTLGICLQDIRVSLGDFWSEPISLSYYLGPLGDFW